MPAVQTWAGIIAGHHAQHKTQDLLYHSPVFCTAVLRDSQWKTTMCSSRLSPKVLWSQRRDVIDYSWLWVKPAHRKQNWYLSKPRRLFFFPALWLILSFTCDSLVLSPSQGLAREPQRKQLIRNFVWIKRISFMFSTHPCFVWALKTTVIIPPPAQILQWHVPLTL